jgi:translation initiation factor 2 subunit 1
MDYPERDEIVIVTVTKVLDYGVFVELLEYNQAKGFVHISNVSRTWVKNIRNFVKLGQIRAAKVLNIDMQKSQVDLSFGAVSAQREKQKINDYRQFKRSEKLIEALAKQNNKKFDDVWEAVAEPLIEEFGTLHDGFKKIALGSEIDKIIASEWIKPLKELVEKNISISEKILRGVAKVSSFSSTGLEDVKEIVKEMEKVKGCEIIYNGAGSYSVSCTALTFKSAEKILNSVVEGAEKIAKKKGAVFSFKKIED